MSRSNSQVHAAYAECAVAAGKHYENFPVASFFLSKARRNALAAIYAFARAADDFADEPGPRFQSPESRLEALADWRRRLEACYGGESYGHPVFIALGDAVRKFGLTRDYLERLIHAFEMDVRTHRHRDFASLLHYCNYSANPVGRLMLELHAYRASEMMELSDAFCTALQLANFWQDAGLDLDRDRIYLPLDDLEKIGLTVQDLSAIREGQDQQKIERFQRLMALEIARTADLFERARTLPEQVTMGLRFQLRMTWWGGVTILTKIQRMKFMTLSARPSIGKWDVVTILLKSLGASSACPVTLQPPRAS
ncbi:MAG TPA: squalene synthase HpnC [Terriglobia bacterium]|nr:squalene synthase HpnC [Terriglobia bacterium]